MIDRRDSGRRTAAYVNSKLRRLAQRKTASRWVNTIATHDRPPEMRVALVSILLVEQSARPPLVRALEWAVALPSRILTRRGTTWRAAKITVGPLQLRGGAWRRDRAVGQAADILTHSQIDLANLDEIARCWNGPATTTASSRFTYAEALRMAQPLAIRLLEQRQLP